MFSQLLQTVLFAHNALRRLQRHALPRAAVCCQGDDVMLKNGALELTVCVMVRGLIPIIVTGKSRI